MNERVVFDCMVYLQAAINVSGPAFACLRVVEEGQAVLLISAEIIAEMRDVLTRPRLAAKFPNLTPARVEAFLRTILARAVLVTVVPSVASGLRDPDDEPYLNLAIGANAEYLVSRDKDLLDLMNDMDFRARFPTLTILDPVAFLERCRGAR